MPETNQATEMDSLKQRLKSTWSAGDFGQIAKSYQRFCLRQDSRCGCGGVFHG